MDEYTVTRCAREVDDYWAHLAAILEKDEECLTDEDKAEIDRYWDRKSAMEVAETDDAWRDDVMCGRV